LESIDDTIVARSTPPGQGALAVIRISGPDAATVLSRVIRTPGPGPVAEPRRLKLAWAVDSGGRRLDEVLVVFMPGPGSYTGEDTGEIHCHGGEAVVAAIINELTGAGARGAMRGEFTRRALLNQKLDLSRAEAVMRIITADSREQVLGATRLLGGEVEKLARQLKEELLGSLTLVEAAIDFGDEPEASNAAPGSLEELVKIVEELQASVRRVAQEETEVVVAGRPNVGKSSLVNRVAKRPVSIVTPEPGTTRDAVRAGIFLHGVRVDLVDTAGQGDFEQRGEAAREAERIAREKVVRAGFLIWVTDRPGDLEDKPPVQAENQPPSLFVVNKSDLMSAEERQVVERSGRLLVSARTGEGIEEMCEVLSRRLCEAYGPADGIPLTSRQEEALGRIRTGAERASAALRKQQPELAAVDLRDALAGVAGVLGEDLEIDVLDRIFSDFCIGK
jgi:tRNA modification GTPase